MTHRDKFEFVNELRNREFACAIWRRLILAHNQKPRESITHCALREGFPLRPRACQTPYFHMYKAVELSNLDTNRMVPSEVSGLTRTVLGQRKERCPQGVFREAGFHYIISPPCTITCLSLTHSLWVWVCNDLHHQPPISAGSCDSSSHPAKLSPSSSLQASHLSPHCHGCSCSNDRCSTSPHP